MADALELYSPQVSVIGSILLTPSLMGEAMLTLREEDFLSPQCKVCWSAMCRIFREGLTVDPVLLRDRLTGFDGATAFLAQCMEAAPVFGNFQSHVSALRRQAMLFRLKELGCSLNDAADLEEAMELLAKANEVSIRTSAREHRTLAQMFSSFGKRRSSTVTPEYLPWPLEELNQGIHAGYGKMIVIGGYPSDGKTAFAIQCAEAMADKDIPSALYSLETDGDTCEDRTMASLLGLPMDRIQKNTLNDQDWARWAAGGGKYANKPFTVVPAAQMTVDDIRADALANRYKVIFIDYLQLISPGRRNNNYSRYDEVSEISRGLQQLAKSTGITVVALSQMSRPPADKNGKIPVPTMHNLRESGQIEQDADVIMLLYRTDIKDIRAPRYLDIDKNKEGTTGHFTLNFDGLHQRFAVMPEPETHEGMPDRRKKTHSTPVIGRTEPEMEQYSYLDGEDSNLPY